jgi:hypothetical protein
MPIRAHNDSVTLLNGSPSYLGTIVATTTKNNHDTATPFVNTGDALAGLTLLVQSDVACYVLAGTANTATVTTGNGVKLEANEKYVITMSDRQGWLAALAVSGTANVKVWQLV